MVRARLALWLEEEAQARRPALWLPVFFGAGLLAYFAADREPYWWAPALALAICAGATIGARRAYWPVAANAFLCLTFLFAGFVTGSWRTQSLSAPVLTRTTSAQVTAFVETIDPRPGGARLLVRAAMIAGLAPAATPVRLRVNMRGAPNFEAGATIRATMRLLPPPRPSEPGGYDFSRDAWFQQIGAVGSVSSRPQIAPDAGVQLIARLNAAVDRARNRLTHRIATVIGGPSGAVAAALVTGKRGMIPEETNEALRGAGIYHVVSISGLHMVLAAGLFLWSLRALLALFPALALRYPIKTWAAIFAMGGSVAYCIFAGSEVATERSLVMTLIILGAVVFGRPAFSMRNLALAALVVMLLEPQALLGPSFQMSFAAVAAMIAAFEQRAGRIEPSRFALDGSALSARDSSYDARATWFGRLRVMLVAMIVTTLVASLATDPYSAFHFHRITPFGLIGNMLALPVVEFIVMPAAVFGTLATAFGLDAPVWSMMGYGVDLMMRVAHWVAAMSGSTLYLRAYGAGALLLLTLALVWITLWQTPIRWAGLAPLAAGLALAAAEPRPDIMIDRQGRTVAWRTGEGTLSVMNARANRFGASQWLSSDADPRKPDDASLARASRCDRNGCTAILRDGRTLALTLERSALITDCQRADILVTPIFAQRLCKGPELLIDGAVLQQRGALEIFVSPQGNLRLRQTRHDTQDRPWSPAPPIRARINTARANATPASQNSGTENFIPDATPLPGESVWTRPD